MNFFKRLSNGWKLALMSLETLQQQPSLLLMPVFSTISLILILISFFGGGYFLIGDTFESLLNDENAGSIISYLIIFVYYLINFFIIVFFNSALIHCSIKLFKGEETSISDGLSFASSRIGKIVAWALVAATVGTALRVIQNTGKIGEIVAALFGMAWSIVTFFVVPVIIYEDKGVFESVSQSKDMMMQKWGESIGANVGFGLFYFLGILLLIPIAFLCFTIHPVVGVLVPLTLFLMLNTTISAAKTVFVAAVYNRTVGLPTGNFDDDILDSAFVTK